MKNIWLYTEERPKADVIKIIIQKFLDDKGYKASFSEKIQIMPIMKDGKFTFLYEARGVDSDKFAKVYIKTVSGNSSFVDYMLFYQEAEPKNGDKPLHLIEETKTDDKESRNTGVYQRCSKFVYADFFYPDVPKIMLYNLRIEQKEKPTATYVFGTRMLITLGVEIMGKRLDKNIFKPFESIDEIIAEKGKMRKPPKGNVPVEITKFKDKITISAKLEKAGRLSHDPNIGMTTIISACLRKLGWKNDIVITKHALPNQQSVGRTNKFVSIANQIGIKLEGLSVPDSELNELYWKPENSQEKIGTIFTSILCEEFAEGVAIYENHGGCERGYFIAVSDIEATHIVIPKYSDRQKYKAGDKTYIIYIPDVVIFDKKRNIVINGEGKTFANKAQGLQELNNFDFFEENFIKEYYPNATIKRTLILFGGDEKSVSELEIGLLLNMNGEVVFGKNTPEIFKEAYENLLSVQ